MTVVLQNAGPRNKIRFGMVRILCSMMLRVVWLGCLDVAEVEMSAQAMLALMRRCGWKHIAACHLMEAAHNSHIK